MKAQFLEHLAISRDYTLNVADAMPEDAYEFSPAPGVWSFRELMHHIAYGILWWRDNYILQQETAWAPTPVKGNKAQIRQELEAAYASLEDTVSAGGNIHNGFHATLDHISHHRGQATISLRIQGIVPPEYNF
ncbi:DinB family protein [Chitinophaga barathri]|uniref:DinB-like domain-containing protein n=1 Tax=Chitinophaga barathri TaxID=1647451 RepID=A0A3N4MHI5_9BACT|nr:DinB family protein [Chitinophaga barathri]RPD42885.1 hypothetical protein EG028_00880 [Chitinophaga barathri]